MAHVIEMTDEEFTEYLSSRIAANFQQKLNDCKNHMVAAGEILSGSNGEESRHNAAALRAEGYGRRDKDGNFIPPDEYLAIYGTGEGVPLGIINVKKEGSV